MRYISVEFVFMDCSEIYDVIMVDSFYLDIELSMSDQSTEYLSQMRTNGAGDDDDGDRKFIAWKATGRQFQFMTGRYSYLIR